MAIALVGSAGAIATTASGTTVSPTFAQATTAGNLLVARVAGDANIGGTLSTTATGWVAIGSSGTVILFYKKNCGASETAPVFTSSTTRQLWADLLEFSGADTVSPLDQTGGNSGSFTAVNSLTDTGGTDVAIAVWTTTDSKSCTFTFTDGWNGSGSTVAAQGTGATKTLGHFYGSARIYTAAPGVPDQNTLTATPSTGTTSGFVNIASFLAVVPQAPAPPIRRAMQAVARASNW